jgi:phage shock protein C
MKRLYRLKHERILGGVCAGLGEHLNVDPTVIRLIWVAVTLLSLGTGLVIYIIAWIIIPEECLPNSAGPSDDQGKTD